MGIHGLIKYAAKYSSKEPYTEVDLGSSIYCSKVVYVDATFKLI